ncbi:MAG: transposase [Flavobacteriales bacterium]|jgi:REP element-mobilizing transposase RayT|nr:transposase [Flavobacteriales bacterium]MCB0757446.1 transposase [Flavobacteriales bacterium]
MSERRKANVQGAAYFVTITVLGWVDVFTRKVLADELIKNIQYCQRNKGLRVFAYVIMSNHVHMIVQREGGTLAEWIRDFKSFTAKRIIHLIETHPDESRRDWLSPYFREQGKLTAQSREYAFWAKTNHPIELYTQPVFDQKVNYIHNNPVVAGIVAEPEHYLPSSAHPEQPLKLNGYDP